VTKEFHPVASIFPLMVEDEFNDLVTDIKQNGLLEPIWLDKDGLIIDGRNRYLACKRALVEPEYRTYDGDGSLVALVVSLNLKRRHLTGGQKAMLSLKIISHLEEEAKERQREAGRLYGESHPKEEKVTPEFPKEDVSTTVEVVETIPQPLSQKAFMAIDIAEKIKAATKKKQEENKSRTQAAAITGTNYHYVSDAKRIADTAPEVAIVVEQGKINIPDAKRIAKLDEPQRKKVLDKVNDGLKAADAIRETQRENNKANLESIETMTAKETNGVYDVIVIDPPWPMLKIESDIRPNQVAFDYPTMPLGEIAEMNIPCADNCHVWLWTTQKFLPAAFDIVNAWGLKYVCTFVWHKPGGFQPFCLPQYNCEFALYCRKGSPKFQDTKGFQTCFSGARNGHSVKPEEFYDVVRRVTAGRRLDTFNRREIDGFETWGNQAADATFFETIAK
jgi:N6-adenosine-specific RNA methylase IME4